MLLHIVLLLTLAEQEEGCLCFGRDYFVSNILIKLYSSVLGKPKPTRVCRLKQSRTESSATLFRREVQRKAQCYWPVSTFAKPACFRMHACCSW
jgi:hypothetical protein